MKNDITTRQQQVRAYIQEYGISAAASGTGLSVYDIRRTYVDTDPVYDHLVRVYQFYIGLAHEQSQHDIHYSV